MEQIKDIKYLKVTPNKGYQRRWLTTEKINLSKKFKLYSESVAFSHPMDKDNEFSPYCTVRFPLKNCEIITVEKINNLWHLVYKNGN